VGDIEGLRQRVDELNREDLRQRVDELNRIVEELRRRVGREEQG